MMPRVWCFLRGAGCSLAVVVAANAFGYAVGCQPEPPPKDPSEAIRYCTGEARAAHYVGQVSDDEALAIFDQCMREHGQ